MKKTETIKLSDGKDYTMTTLNVGDLIEIEEKFGSTDIDTSKTKNNIYWLWLSLKKAHKDMKLEDLYELIDANFISKNGLTDIFTVMSRLNGWDKVSKNVESLAKEVPQV